MAGTCILCCAGMEATFQGLLRTLCQSLLALSAVASNHGKAERDGAGRRAVHRMQWPWRLNRSLQRQRLCSVIFAASPPCAILPSPAVLLPSSVVPLPSPPAPQSPIEVPGVSNVDFLRLSFNAKRAARGEPEMEPLEVGARQGAGRMGGGMGGCQHVRLHAG